MNSLGLLLMFLVLAGFVKMVVELTRRLSDMAKVKIGSVVWMIFAGALSLVVVILFDFNATELGAEGLPVAVSHLVMGAGVWFFSQVVYHSVEALKRVGRIAGVDEEVMRLIEDGLKEATKKP